MLVVGYLLIYVCVYASVCVCVSVKIYTAVSVDCTHMRYHLLCTSSHKTILTQNHTHTKPYSPSPLLQVSLMRLNAVAAILSVEEHTPHVLGQLQFLQCLLAYAVKCLDTYCGKELQYIEWDGHVAAGVCNCVCVYSSVCVHVRIEYMCVWVLTYTYSVYVCACVLPCICVTCMYLCFTICALLYAQCTLPIVANTPPMHPNHPPQHTPHRKTPNNRHHHRRRTHHHKTTRPRRGGVPLHRHAAHAEHVGSPGWKSASQVGGLYTEESIAHGVCE